MESIEDILRRNGLSKFQTSSTTSSNGKGKQAKRMTASAAPKACKFCGGVGFVIPDVLPDHPKFGRAVPCQCKREELDSRRNERLVKMSQLGQLSNLTFKAFVADGYGLSPDKARNLRQAYERAFTFAKQPEGWLMFKGGYGCGKTHLAAAIANYQIEHNREVLFVNTPDLLDHLRGTYRPGSDISYDQRFEQVRNVPLLVLDDLGAHNSSDWAQEKLYQIFNYRYNSRLPTVVTTNEDLDSIEARVRSRLSDLSFVQLITILAPDFRRGGVYQEESDLSTLHLHNDKTFESFNLRRQELTRPQAGNLERAFKIAHEFSEQPEGWLILNSTAYGNGKTHLAAAVANELAKRGQRVLFIVVPDLLDHLRDTFNPSVSARLGKRFNDIKTSPMLVLDDLGTESATAWAREKLYQLFNYRYNAQLPTIITTTTPWDELDPRLASRFYSPLCTAFNLESPSYRGPARRKSNGGGGRGSGKTRKK